MPSLAPGPAAAAMRTEPAPVAALDPAMPAEAPAGSGAALARALQESSSTASGWWSGTAALASDAPEITEQGPCAPYGDGGHLALMAGGPLSQACSGDVAPTGSVRGVGWFEGYGDSGAFVAVELVGGPGIGAGVYRALG